MDIFDTPFVHDAGRDMPGIDQVSQPLGGIRVNFVVVSGYGFASPAGVIG